ncbi:MAG: hypothetical protein AB7Q37_18790 [Pyrinomonadaceae bacterium]
MREQIAVWFSCGAASAVAAKITIIKYSDNFDIRIVNNPVAEEFPDNIRFLRDVERWIGCKIESVINPKWPDCSAVQVWEKEKYMSGISGAPCTRELKRRARQYWENENKFVKFHVLGFTYEELKRFERFKKFERDNVLPVLIEAGITKQKCFDILNDAGILLPESYRRGYANANCRGCVKVTSASYWNFVREDDPDIFYQRAVQSRRIGAKLVRHSGKRIFLDELPVDAKGRRMKKFNIPECGIFCEEK